MTLSFSLFPFFVFFIFYFLYSIFLLSRQGSYKLVESDEQWQAVQQQYRGRGRTQSQSGVGMSNGYHGGPDQYNGGPVQPAAAGRRSSGYMNSGADTETEMVSTTSSMRRNRRRQRFVRVLDAENTLVLGGLRR
jgi:hypothetical protein